MKRFLLIVLFAAAAFAGQCLSECFGCDACADGPVKSEDLRVFDELIAEQRMLILMASAAEKPELAKGLEELATFRQRLESCSSCPLDDTDRTRLVEIMRRRATRLTNESDIRLYEGLSSLLERVRQCVAKRRNKTACGTCRKNPCCCPAKPACCEKKTACCEEKKAGMKVSFNVSNQCGARFSHSVDLTNATEQQICDGGERSDMAFNAVIGSQSWGCHVRPEPTTIIVNAAAREPYWCERYGYPPPYGYRGYRYSSAAYTTVPAVPAGYAYPYALSANAQPYAVAANANPADPRNPVRTVPPGTPSRGCHCPGQVPGQSCTCGPDCPVCQGGCAQ